MWSVSAMAAATAATRGNMSAAARKFSDDAKTSSKTASGAAKESASNVRSEPGEGLRSVATTNVFRAVNFELYARPARQNYAAKTSPLSLNDDAPFRTGT